MADPIPDPQPAVSAPGGVVFGVSPNEQTNYDYVRTGFTYVRPEIKVELQPDETHGHVTV